MNMTLSLDCLLGRMDTTLQYVGARASATALNSMTVILRSSHGAACLNLLWRTTVPGNMELMTSPEYQAFLFLKGERGREEAKRKA